MTPDQQSAVLTEAHRWLNTPYLHQGAVLGAGVDCIMLLACVFHAAGIVPWIDPRPYPIDWMLHHTEERYLAGLDQHAERVDGEPQPADIVTFRVGRTHSHAAIVVAWPTIIHAYRPAGRVTLDQADSTALAERMGPVYRVQPSAEVPA